MRSKKLTLKYFLINKYPLPTLWIRATKDKKFPISLLFHSLSLSPHSPLFTYNCSCLSQFTHTHGKHKSDFNRCH